MLAHVFTGLRLALALPFFAAMSGADVRAATLSAGCLLIAVSSDLLDGPIARRQGSASPFGRAFDHLTDGAFVTAGLAGGALRGAFPWLLPVLVVLAFAQYVLDSVWLRGSRELIMSSLGRWNGILYFAPLLGDVLARLGSPALRAPIHALCWLLIASTLLSMADRARALVRYHHRA
jgi:phosphatidylglycerophosphate synthase